METSIEFFLYLVAMARILVVFLRIQNVKEVTKNSESQGGEKSLE